MAPDLASVVASGGTMVTGREEGVNQVVLDKHDCLYLKTVSETHVEESSCVLR